MSQDSIKVGNSTDDVKQEARYFQDRLQTFIQPLAQRLDRLIDRRLVSTFETLLGCIIRFRHNSLGLILSELGGKLLGEQHAPAGTKRISNLLRNKAWSHTLIDEFLLEKAQGVAHQLQDQHQVGVLLWDESVIEKPESIRPEGLCAVRSSKAKRLKRIKLGFFNPPGGRPVHVPGFDGAARAVDGFVVSRSEDSPDGSLLSLVYHTGGARPRPLDVVNQLADQGRRSLWAYVVACI